MSLLNDLFQHSIDEGSAEAAARREAEGKPASSRSLPAKSPAMMAGLLMIGLLFTTAAMHVQRDAGVVSAEKTSLLEQVEQASDRSTALTRSRLLGSLRQLRAPAHRSAVGQAPLLVGQPAGGPSGSGDSAVYSSGALTSPVGGR